MWWGDSLFLIVFWLVPSIGRDVLDQVRKTESSLKRLKGRKAGAADDPTKGGKAEISDTDKICHQLLLDVQVRIVVPNR